jgi:hypothetical protein
VEVATFDKILDNFSPIVPTSAAGFASVASDAGGLVWWKLERSKSLVLLQVGRLTCGWQRHSVKPSWWESSTTVEQAETQLRVVVPIEEEEECIHNFGSGMSPYELCSPAVCWSCTSSDVQDKKIMNENSSFLQQQMWRLESCRAWRRVVWKVSCLQL